jgi:hypothetical protein
VSIKQICKPQPPKTCEVQGATNLHGPLPCVFPPPPGNCNITIINSVVTGNVTDCSIITIVVTCGNLSATFTGSKDTAQQQANTWQQANCQTTTPTCPSGTTGTPPNCTPIPCEVTGTCPTQPVSLTLSNLTQPQNGPGGIMPDGEVVTACVTATDTKPGDTVILSFGSHLGFYENHGKVMYTATGVDTECAVYHAPTDSGDVGQTETWTVTGVDITAGVTATPISVSFMFQPLPGGDH